MLSWTYSEFEWDEGNKDKNLKKHDVSVAEIEQVFFDDKKKEFIDPIHSGVEARYRVVGETNDGRLLFVVFTRREDKIRVISARDVNRKEISLYEETASIAKI